MEKPDVLKLLERPLSERDVKTINDAIQQARQDTARQLIEEIEKTFNWIYQGVNEKPWQSLKSKYLIPPNPVGSAEL